MADFIVPDWPAPARVAALVTTRSGGVSEERYGSFNLAGHVGDDPRHVAENRARLRLRLPGEPLWLEQVHGSGVVCAEDAPAERRADAAVSRRAGMVCAVLSADCLPVLLCDRAGSVVGIAHAGWRGLAGGVIEASVAAMGVAGRELVAWLGPAIGPRSYEVGGEVRAAFLAGAAAAAAAFVPHGPQRWLCDLYALARLRLGACGVTQVSGGHFDTCAEAERFYSYRREGVTGRMASLVWLA